MGIVSLHISMQTMFAVSILMLFTCAFSAMHLFGVRSTLQFMFVSIGIGFLRNTWGIITAGFLANTNLPMHSDHA